MSPAGDTTVAGKITWKFDLDGFSEKKFTYKVTVTAGFGTDTLVNTATWVEGKLSDKTEHPVKALKAAVTSFCVKDAPYYSLTITPQNGKLFSSQEATVKWYQATPRASRSTPRATRRRIRPSSLRPTTRRPSHRTSTRTP